MNDALVIARLCLATVFLLAGIAKLADRVGTRQALADFGVPLRLARPLQFLLPAGELAAATALVLATTGRWGAIGSLLLLSLFVAGLTRALRRGETPDCHCFGQLHSKPASWATVARNLLLALPAAYVALEGPGPSLSSWVNRTNATDLALIATSALATLAVAISVLLWRENHRTLTAGHRAIATPRQIGALAPDFTLPSTAGRTISLQDLLADNKPCVLAFVSPGCGPCKALIPEFARWQKAIIQHLALAFVIPAKATEAERLAHEHTLINVLIDKQSTVSHAYGAIATPSAILIAPDGTVSSILAAGAVTIESLIRLALQGETRPTPTGAHHNTPLQATSIAA